MSCLRNSIRQIDPCLQELVDAIENASTLTLLILSALLLTRALAVRIVEEVLIERAQRPTQWSDCPKCGKRLHSKGFVSRQITSVIGVIRWKRRVGRCPHVCEIGQIAPLDNILGLLPHQRTSFELQKLGCLLAVFVPFDTVSVILNCLTSVQVMRCGIGFKTLVARRWIDSMTGWRSYLQANFHRWSYWMRQLAFCPC